MNNAERKEYVLYRIKTSFKTLNAAEVLAKNKYWNSAVNRLYYSLFYAVNALLVLNKIITKSHSGTKKQFSINFIKTGKIDKKYGRLFAQLFDWRQKGDYDNIFEYDSDTVLPLFDLVKEMLQEIESIIINEIQNSSDDSQQKNCE
jgi:uncharacterized protein